MSCPLPLRIGSASLVLTFAAFTLAGCATGDPNARYDIVAPVTPAMELDPTNVVELPQWFSNGAQTLEFDATGHYRMYEGTNRHAKPIERGRWVRINYASVSIEPYATGKAGTPVRASLFMDGDKLGMRLPKLPPMMALDGAPLAIEDELFGKWTGNDASLSLGSGMRFIYVHDTKATGPATLAPISGTWSVTDEGVQLTPDTSAMDPAVLVIKRDGETVMLEGFNTKLTRQ